MAIRGRWWALLAVVSLLATGAGYWSLWGGDGRHRPTVVIAMIDTLRADYLGTYGFRGPISPAIDAIAREGVVFERCAAPAPWTKPSIASLFTGLEPDVHRVLTEEGKYRIRKKTERREVLDVLAPDFTTMAESFQAAGYRTAAFVANPWIRSELGFAQGFDEFHVDQRETVPETERKYPGAALLDGVRDFLQRRPADQPLFLYVHFMEVHGPYDAPEEDFRALSESDSLGPPQRLLPVRFKLMPPYLRGAPWVESSEANDVRVWRARYGAGVRVVDRHIASLRQLLEGAGVFDDAIVIVTADHGEQLYDHQGWDHGYSLFEDQVHVPLIVRMPKKLSAGTRIPSLVGLTDVMPTLLNLVRIEAPQSQGEDFSSALKSGSPLKDDRVAYGAAVKWNPEGASIRNRRYKLIVNKIGQPAQLYDLEHDANERTDIAKEYPELVKQLQAQLEDHQKTIRPTIRADQPAGTLPEGAAERLRALGYLKEEKTP